MSEHDDETTAESSCPAKPAPPSQPTAPRLAPPTRAVERSQWAESFAAHEQRDDGPRRFFEPTTVPPTPPTSNPLTPAQQDSAQQESAPGTTSPTSDTAQVGPATADAAVSSPQSAEGTQTTLSYEESIAGIGEQPASPIHTLPPLIETIGGFPISERTGEPRRSPLVVAVCSLFGLGSLTALATYAWYWWTAINITDFAASSSLISWFGPRPGSGLSIFLVTVMAVIGIVMMALPAMACYNVWHGADWSRRAGIFAAGSGLLSIFVLPWSWLGFLLCAIGCGLLWLPWAAAWMQAWEAINGQGPAEVAVVTDVPYGPLPRFR